MIGLQRTAVGLRAPNSNGCDVGDRCCLDDARHSNVRVVKRKVQHIKDCLRTGELEAGHTWHMRPEQRHRVECDGHFRHHSCNNHGRHIDLVECDASKVPGGLCERNGSRCAAHQSTDVSRSCRKGHPRQIDSKRQGKATVVVTCTIEGDPVDLRRRGCWRPHHV